MIIVYRLAHEKTNEIEMSWSALLEYFGLVNDKFKNYRNHVAYEDIKNNIRPISDIGYMDWGTRAKSGLKRKLRTALNSMKKRQLIEWDEILYCVLNLEDEEGESTKGYKDNPHPKEMHILAGKDERSVKTEAYRTILQDVYHLDDENKLIASGKYYEYIDKVNKYLNDRYRIKMFYTKARISYQPYTISKAIEYTKQNLIDAAAEFNFNVNLEKLNKMLIDMLNNEASSKKANAHNKIQEYYNKRHLIIPDIGCLDENDESQSAMYRFMYFDSEEYLLEQDLFSQYFINRQISMQTLKDKYGIQKDAENEDIAI